MSCSGRSATSGPRLFISIRNAASCCQPWQLRVVPLGERMVLAVSIVVVMNEDSMTSPGIGVRDLGPGLFRTGDAARIPDPGPRVPFACNGPQTPRSRSQQSPGKALPEREMLARFHECI